MLCLCRSRAGGRTFGIGMSESAPASEGRLAARKQSKCFQIVGLATQVLQELSFLRHPRCDVGTPRLGKYPRST